MLFEIVLINYLNTILWVEGILYLFLTLTQSQFISKAISYLHANLLTKKKKSLKV